MLEAGDRARAEPAVIAGPNPASPARDRVLGILPSSSRAHPVHELLHLVREGLGLLGQLLGGPQNFVGARAGLLRGFGHAANGRGDLLRAGIGLLRSFGRRQMPYFFDLGGAEPTDRQCNVDGAEDG